MTRALNYLLLLFVCVVSSGMSAYHTFCHMKNVIEDNKFAASVHESTDQIAILSIQGRDRYKIMNYLCIK